ncbi:MAG: dihydrodipicolinate synthase family protein [Rhodospirillales bacterium]|nr:dihydrodipicolinate synthase family protein [Rhodospirillales bacterium]
MDDFTNGSAFPKPGGIVPSLNTPFAADGDLDRESLERLVDHTVESGCAGMLALAVAGETASLSMAEKHAVIRTVSARTQGRVALIVGVTAPSWQDSLHLAHLARQAGAAAVLWQPETGTGEDCLRSGLEQLGETGPGPVMLQDLDWAGPGLPVDTILRLFKTVPSFRAIKIETQDAGPKYSTVLSATSGRLHVSGGWAASQMMDALSRGVHAFIPTGMESIYCNIHRLFAEGNEKGAERLFDSIRPVLAFSNRDIHTSIRFFKALRLAAGVFASDHCRAPVPPLNDGDAAECRRLIETVLEIESVLSANRLR